jgi:uncharacterized protein YdeI (YjbR/CyaY-like superfamily)
MTTEGHELMNALRKAPKALAAFEVMTPSHQRRWISYVGEATRPEARARRIERCIEELLGAGTRLARATRARRSSRSSA